MGPEARAEKHDPQTEKAQPLTHEPEMDSPEKWARHLKEGGSPRAHVDTRGHYGIMKRWEDHIKLRTVYIINEKKKIVGLIKA